MTSMPEYFYKFDLTTQNLNQNVNKVNKTKPNAMSCKASEKNKLKDRNDKISGETIAFPRNIKVQNVIVTYL